jgi:hypothetical protein
MIYFGNRVGKYIKRKGEAEGEPQAGRGDAPLHRFRSMR